MGSEKDVEMIQRATEQLKEEEEISATNPLSSCGSSVDNEKSGAQRRRQRQLLSKLLYELDSIQEYDDIASKQEADSSPPHDEKMANESGSCSNEDVIKELKIVKRQNLITHCLLTASILLTLTWQLSEVSLILKIKDAFSNPLKSVGGLIRRFLRNRGVEVNNIQDAVKQASEKQKQFIEPASLPGLKIPELPSLELPGFDSSDED